jgi:hypothetical protein
MMMFFNWSLAPTSDVSTAKGGASNEVPIPSPGFVAHYYFVHGPEGPHHPNPALNT